MVALRAVLVYAAIHFVVTSVDRALATRVAFYGRWFQARRRAHSQRPTYAKALRKAAMAFAAKALLDATARAGGHLGQDERRLARP